MTPAEIAALRALCDAATPGPWRLGYWMARCLKPEHRMRHPGHSGPNPCVYTPEFIVDDPDERVTGISGPNDSVVGTEYDELKVSRADAAFIAAARTALPALLSALEEARVEAKANMDGWRKANADYMRLKESEDTDTITNAEILGQRDAYFARALAAESRADDLQAELLELRALEMNHEGACVRLKSERDEARARADAAWRAALDAAASEARIYANCEAPCSCGSKHRMARLASTIAALPPPSATPNEET